MACRQRLPVSKATDNKLKGDRLLGSIALNLLAP